MKKMYFYQSKLPTYGKKNTGLLEVNEIAKSAISWEKVNMIKEEWICKSNCWNIGEENNKEW